MVVIFDTTRMKTEKMRAAVGVSISDELALNHDFTKQMNEEGYKLAHFPGADSYHCQSAIKRPKKDFIINSVRCGHEMTKKFLDDQPPVLNRRSSNEVLDYIISQDKVSIEIYEKGAGAADYYMPKDFNERHIITKFSKPVNDDPL